MNDARPRACALGPADLEQRLAEIRAIGEASLVGHETNAGRHLLRFRSDAATRQQLEELVAAEARCCPFLELDLEERGDELLLSVASR